MAHAKEAVISAPLISIIAAVAENRVIGSGGSLPWDLPVDRAHFKNVTMGHPLIMGRKTFESIGRPLPGRRNIVLTRNRAWRHAGCDTFASLEEALAMVADEEEVFLCGGSELYEKALPRADLLYLTRVRTSVQGDVFFPPFRESEFRELCRERIDDKLPLDFILLERVRPLVLKGVLFDFGGVLAEEGFRDALYEVAGRQRLDASELHRQATDAMYDSGYIIGKGTESDFWELLRQRSGLHGSDSELSAEVLSRFIVRRCMLDLVTRLRNRGIVVAVVSDQTDWLDLIEKRQPFYSRFDRVYNSFKLGSGKRDATLFARICHELGFRPEELLFVDDSPDHLERARSHGLHTLLFKTAPIFIRELESISRFYLRPCPSIS